LTVSISGVVGFNKKLLRLSTVGRILERPLSTSGLYFWTLIKLSKEDFIMSCNVLRDLGEIENQQMVPTNSLKLSSATMQQVAPTNSKKRQSKEVAQKHFLIKV